MLFPKIKIPRCLVKSWHKFLADVAIAFGILSGILCEGIYLNRANWIIKTFFFAFLEILFM